MVQLEGAPPLMDKVNIFGMNKERANLRREEISAKLESDDPVVLRQIAYELLDCLETADGTEMLRTTWFS